jgi:hypothetical protein
VAEVYTSERYKPSHWLPSQTIGVCPKLPPSLFIIFFGHEIDLKNVDKNLQKLALLRDAAGFLNFLGAPIILKPKKYIYSGECHFALA